MGVVKNLMESFAQFRGLYGHVGGGEGGAGGVLSCRWIINMTKIQRAVGEFYQCNVYLHLERLPT